MSAPEIINPPGGGGGGTVTGTGTPGKLAKFTGTGTSIGNSLLSESGTTITSAATAETFGGAQTWTLGAPNAFALIVKSNAGPESTLVLDTISRAVGIGGAPGTLLHVQDAAGYPFAGSTYAGVRLQRSTEALFSASDYTRSFRAGLTGSTAVVGTSTAHDLLLQRGNVTALTLGASGAVAFAGNLTSSAAQTWTLASSTTALNIQSGLLNLDTTNSRVGIGIAAPGEKLTIAGTAGTCVISMVETGVRNWAIRSGGVATNTFDICDLSASASRLAITSTGNVGIGTASPTGRLHVVGGTAAAATNGAPVTIIAQSAGTGNQNGGNIVLTPGALSGTGSAGVADLSGPTGTGLKLPATPGNADAQALDCYAEGTWAPTLAGFVTNTPGTITASYTRVGRMVTLNVYLYAGGSSFGSTLGTTTVTVPSGMTPNFNGVGHGGLSRTVASVAQVIAYYDGKIYLGTSTSAATEMWVSVTYFV